MSRTPASLRVLAIHRYYWPDTPPYATILRSIVEQWHQDGHRVDVLSSQPSYKPESAPQRRASVETVDHARVRRVSMQSDRSGKLRRLFNVAWFPLIVGLRVLFGPKRDVVMCSTAPPVLLGMAVSIAARLRGSRFIYHCMDLHPEIGALSGEFANPFVYRLMARLDLATCRRAESIVVLSEDMRGALLARDPRLAARIVVINNFDLPDFDGVQQTTPVASTPDRLRIAFTGNIGRFQGLETITQAVLSDSPELNGIELVFMGEGAAKGALQALVNSAPADRRPRVAFVPHGSSAQARALLGTADVGLVSLTPKVIGFAFPSKTATYLSAGLPLLVAVERDSELANLVVDERLGWHLPTDDARAIEQRLVAVVEARAELDAMSQRARQVWERQFAASVVLPRWSELLAEHRDGNLA
ncbi:glycosyl transferase [Nocardioides sp. CF8]|uniref:glycosyltransferase family 4 protein n=1 Tax=Nocardioides sp. CF8 TaxID=110319 RepID=UPI0003305FCE|nr:glycosyltransferase family 4 protein [Nocardioides sp. CF8]EON22760.1 glycosyl transferase [Nocardioides sp. CF8]